MQIAYIIFHDITKNDGVTKKIDSQVSFWRDKGHVVNVFCFLPRRGRSILEAEQFASKRYIYNRLFLNREFYDSLINYNPDIVYFRYDVININLIKVISKYKSICELNTLDINEFYLLFRKEKSIKSFLRLCFYFLGRRFILKKIVGLIGVTKEISEHPSYSKFCKNSISVTNSINTRKYRTLKQGANTENEMVRPTLFFIGTPNQPWHGIDIIEEWAKKLLEFDFHIVGISKEDKSNIFYHGYLSKSEYLRILQKSHICIGSLAMHRIHMKEGSPLKVREYLAYGYPTITGYQDSGFYDLSPSFLLNLDISDLLNFDLIKQFVEDQKENIVNRNEIITIDSNYVELQRLEFFEDCLEK